MKPTILTLVVFLAQVEGSFGASPQDEEELTFQAYCSFVIEEAWHKGRDIAATLEQSAKDILLEMASSDDPDKQLCAVMLLAEVGDVRLVPIVAPHVADTSNDPEARHTGCEYIKAFATVEALPAMLGVLSEPLDRDVNGGLQLCAIEVLGSINEVGARQKLREFLGSPVYSWARSRIVISLGRLHDTGAIPDLIVIAQGPIGNVGEKWAATEALAKIGTRESVAPLLDIIQSMPAGADRYDVGIAVAHGLEDARDRTQDPAFRAELEQLIPTIRALAKERPVQ